MAAGSFFRVPKPLSTSSMESRVVSKVAFPAAASLKCTLPPEISALLILRSRGTALEVDETSFLTGSAWFFLPEARRSFRFKLPFLSLLISAQGASTFILENQIFFLRRFEGSKSRLILFTLKKGLPFWDMETLETVTLPSSSTSCVPSSRIRKTISRSVVMVPESILKFIKSDMYAR